MSQQPTAHGPSSRIADISAPILSLQLRYTTISSSTSLHYYQLFNFASLLSTSLHYSTLRNLQSSLPRQAHSTFILYNYSHALLSLNIPAGPHGRSRPSRREPLGPKKRRSKASCFPHQAEEQTPDNAGR